MKLPNLTDKLYNVYKQHKNIIIAVDFDDTIYDWKNSGYDTQYVIDLVKRVINEAGGKVILFTCRVDEMLDFAVQFCADNGIPLYGINANPDFPPTTAKPFYNVFLEDKASLEATCISIEAFLKWIKIDGISQISNSAG